MNPKILTWQIPSSYIIPNLNKPKSPKDPKSILILTMKQVYTYFWNTLPTGTLIWLAPIWLDWAHIAQPTSNHLERARDVCKAKQHFWPEAGHPRKYRQIRLVLMIVRTKNLNCDRFEQRKETTGPPEDQILRENMWCVSCFAVKFCGWVRVLARIFAFSPTRPFQPCIWYDRNKPRRPRGEEQISNARDAELWEHLRALRSLRSSCLIHLSHRDLEMLHFVHHSWLEFRPTRTYPQ